MPDQLAERIKALALRMVNENAAYPAVLERVAHVMVYIQDLDHDTALKTVKQLLSIEQSEATSILNLPKAGMHAFRRGCNRRWELARVSGAVIRQQMGHATADMTTLYTGEIPVEQVLKQFQLEPNGAAIAA